MKAVVLFSGGVDSTTCLGMAIDKYGKENVIALSISYGQKHLKEIEASDKIAAYYGVEHLRMDLEKIFAYSDCSLLQHSDQEIPEESYAEQLEKTDGKPLVFSTRNTDIFVTSYVLVLKYKKGKSGVSTLFS